MRARIVLVGAVVATLAVARDARVARADDDYPADARTPRPFWIGVNGGVSLDSTYDPQYMITQFNAGGLFGLDVGVSQTERDHAFELQADVLPVGGVYKLRADAIWGYGTTMKYRVPCSAPPGYSCTATYLDRDVRTVFGLKGGIQAGRGLDDRNGALLEVGLALHSQISTSASFVYDLKGYPGFQYDLQWQIGAFYVGMETLGTFSAGSTVPFLALMSAGFTPAMW